MTKIAGSGSIHQRHESTDPDPDPHKNVMDPQHCLQTSLPKFIFNSLGTESSLIFSHYRCYISLN
jgi:hypothetical protein